MHIVAGVTVHAAPWRAAGEVTQRSGVAVVAREVLVGAGQMEIGLGVVVEPPPLPTIGVMTAAAVLAEVCVVVVVGRVTVDALAGDIAEGAREMALTATDAAVQSQQWKSREVVVEEHFAEQCLAVAAMAALAEMTRVNVVGAVTVGALHGHRSRESIGVTDDALHVFMRSVQCEIGVAGMIEFDSAPASLIVTFRAVVPELAAMIVVLCVTCDAARGCGCVIFGQMASSTRCLAMSAAQWKVGAIVIERRSTPAGCVMAACAIGPELAIVCILVASVAFAHCLVERLVVHVTALACNRAM